MSDEEQEPPKRRKKKELTPEEYEKGRKDILEAVSTGRDKKLRDKVAWILNHNSSARNSDITLSLRFWEKYHPEYLEGNYIEKKNLFKLTKTTSLKRERARIQNDFKLFLASDEVRKKRGVLEEEQFSTAISISPDYPISIIYADESGKNSDHLIVGSIWFLDGYETVRIQNVISEWKKNKGINYEFHFSELKKSRLQEYKDLIDLVFDESAKIGFKGLSVEKTGNKGEKVFEDLFYHLIIKGIEHDNQTGRAPIPRQIQFWKDQETPGGDKVLLANIKDRVIKISDSKFDNQIHLDTIESVDSKSLIHIQLSDLFTGTLNRVLNIKSTNKNYKDEFANYFIEKFNIQLKDTKPGDISSLLTFN